MKSSLRIEDKSRVFVQKTETEYLEKLAASVQALQILFQQAEKKARGKREGGCGCPSCKKRAITAQEKLNKAKVAYRDERIRLYGKHVDQEL